RESTQVRTEFRLAPARAAVWRHFHSANAFAAIKSDPFQWARPAGSHANTGLRRDEERTDVHAIDRDRLLRQLGWQFHSIERRWDAIRLGHPVAVELLRQDRDFSQALDPVGRVPARNNEAQWKAVEERQRLPVHLVREQDVRPYGLLERQRLREIGHGRISATVEGGEGNIYGPALDLRLAQQVPERHSGPAGVPHRPIAPLRSRHVRLEQAA